MIAYFRFTLLGLVLVAGCGTPTKQTTQINELQCGIDQARLESWTAATRVEEHEEALESLHGELYDLSKRVDALEKRLGHSLRRELIELEKDD